MAIKVGDVLRDGTGASVRIVCVDAAYRNLPIVGLRRDVKSTHETIEAYRVDGRYFEKSQYEKDERNLVLPTRKVSVVIVRIGDTAELSSAIFDSKEKHDRFLSRIGADIFKVVKTIETEIPDE